MAASGRLVARIAPVASLDETTREAMWALFVSLYDGADRATFLRDLSEKRDVILARDSGDGTIHGFSTLTWHAREHEGRRVIALFSGDTVIARPYWGQRALQAAFGRYFTRLKLAHPLTPLYWFLVSKGYKTYLLLARNFPERWPRPDVPTPARDRALLDALATERFGAAYDADRGVVRAPGKDRVKDGVAPIDAALLADPDVRFFVTANPGWTEGDELACLAPIRIRLYLAYLAKGLRRRSARSRRGSSWAPS